MDTTQVIRLKGSPRIDHEDVIIMRKPLGVTHEND
jgi:hypothetical protein